MIRPEDFLQEDLVFHFGVAPWRVDILTSVPGVDFETAYKERVRMRLEDMEMDVISRDWLIRAKRASARHQDLADAEKLEQAE